MNEDGSDPVEAMHREAVERYREEEECGRRLVEKIHREAVEQYREQRRQEDELIDRMHREAVERPHPLPLPPAGPRDVEYTELPEAKPDSPLYHEWNAYRREVGRLLAEGNAGRH